METSRLEIFADAIFAIAAALLILDVSVHAPAELRRRHIYGTEVWT